MTRTFLPATSRPAWQRPRIALAAAGTVFVIFAFVTTLWHPGLPGPTTDATDFRAFYCAGAALDAGRDPFLVEPTRSCQRDSLAAAGLAADPRNVLIAPLPSYALALFAVVARLPYRLAVELWLTASIVALLVAIVGLRRLTGLPPVAVALALFASAGFASFVIGQIVPIIIAALVVAASAARARDGRVVAVALGVVALEPHLALGAWVAAAGLLPWTRRPLVVAALVLTALAVIVGLPLNVEYATAVLPMHVRSELMTFALQYSFSSLLWFLGVPVGLALSLGAVSYVAMLAAGVRLAFLLRRRFDDAAFVVLAPVAASLAGGPFVHLHQIAAAVPLGLLVLGRVNDEPLRHALVVAALALLAVPWENVAGLPGVIDVLPHRSTIAQPAVPVPAATESLERADTDLSDARAGRDPRTRLGQLLCKVPTWAGLGILVVIAFAASGERYEAYVRARGRYRRAAYSRFS